MKSITNTFKIVNPDLKIEDKTISEIIKEKTIFFFYPKDNTPGCTNENLDFTVLKSEFEALWYSLIWISKDSPESHIKFIEWKSLKNPLISDPDLLLHNHLWAYGEKNNYGKLVMWVIRSTYLVNENWKVEKEWKNIRAKWHAERILKELKEAK